MQSISRVFLLVLILSMLALGVACTSGDDDDDAAAPDDDATGDDDTGADDDAGDDDTSVDDDVDDDTVDDDTGDDDTGDDDTGDDDTGDDDTSSTTTTTTVPTTTTTTTTPTTTSTTTTTNSGPVTLFDIDFESYSLGPLGVPWEIVFQAGTSTGDVVTLTKAGSGQGLEVDGGTGYGTDYWGGMYTFDDTSTDMYMAYDVRCASGAAMGFRFMQDYSGYPYGEFTVYTDPADGSIMASNPSGNWEDCGTLAADTWTNIEFDVDFNGGSYDVVLDGSPVGACTGLSLDWGDGTPFGYFMVADFSDDGFGGICDYDNFYGETM